jgi:proteasome accessory factor C
MSDAAAARLRRILSLLPLIADDETHAVEDVLVRTGTNRETLLSDLVALTQRYDDSGAVESSVQIVYDETSISMYAPRFRRPPRITVSELTAIELGLALLRRERPPDEWPVIDRALERLRSVIVRLPRRDADSDVYAADVSAAPRVEALGVLRRALRVGKKVVLCYQGSMDAGPVDRVVRPYGFVFASGMWYVVGHCERVGGERIFRADRIESAELTTESFKIPTSFSLGAFVAKHRAFDGTAGVPMKVKYSPAIARWIAEREGKELAADGSLTMEHPVADRGWAIRHVLQYGAEAEVPEPAELRAEIAAVLDRMAASC